MKNARTPLIGAVAGLALASLAGGASGATFEAHSAPAVPATAGAVQVAQQIAIPTGEKRAKGYKTKKVADRSGTNDGTVAAAPAAEVVVVAAADLAAEAAAAGRERPPFETDRFDHASLGNRGALRMRRGAGSSRGAPRHRVRPARGPSGGPKSGCGWCSVGSTGRAQGHTKLRRSAPSVSRLAAAAVSTRPRIGACRATR